jgi:DNA-binding CsgD family transcriptional regulator
MKMLPRNKRWLREADLRRFSEAVGLLHHEYHDDTCVAVMKAVQILMPSVGMSAEAWDLDSRALRHVAHDCPSVKFEEAAEALVNVGHENPAIAHVTKHGPIPTIKISDLRTVRQLRQTGYYREVSRYFPFQDQASILAVAGREIFGFASFLDRTFSDEEMILLELLQPHVRLALDRAHRLRGVPVIGGLTLREQEILLWMVEGKTDPEIATILRIGLRTVNCHVGRILGKLAVENRASAVSLVWRWRVSDKTVP